MRCALELMSEDHLAVAGTIHCREGDLADCGALLPEPQVQGQATSRTCEGLPIGVAGGRPGSLTDGTARSKGLEGSGVDFGGIPS